MKDESNGGAAGGVFDSPAEVEAEWKRYLFYFSFFFEREEKMKCFSLSLLPISPSTTRWHLLKKALVFRLEVMRARWRR